VPQRRCGRVHPRVAKEEGHGHNGQSFPNDAKEEGSAAAWRPLQGERRTGRTSPRPGRRTTVSLSACEECKALGRIASTDRGAPIQRHRVHTALSGGQANVTAG